ncbi:MAG: hypothetical protein LBT46_05570 [Planctomycetaceae bacterium]|nr:hypothetical protein [Planctomycetaceae bacterium]
MPNRYENLKKLDDVAFRRIIGTERCVFDKMLVIVHLFHFPQHKQGGASNKISLADYGVNRKMKKENNNREGAKKTKNRKRT